MLLIIEALLLISAALGKDHRAAVKGKIFPLDMENNSVDDQYDGCIGKMKQLVENKYLKKELNNSRNNFKIAWQEGEKYSKKPENNLTQNHSIAIYVYTGDKVFRDFNNETRNGKQNYTTEQYSWYSLHFLLTEAVQILNQTQNTCYDTYRRTKVEFDKDVLNKEVRFGSFTSSSIDRDKGAKIFGTVSCFEINTCEGAEVTNYSKLSREREVLIPPYETFNVTSIRKKGDEKDLWCDTVYTLKNTGKTSNLNCALFRRPNKTKDKYHVLH
ncbi:NAD(P)(+)--arginine ADP-ribosyltransferase 2-like [Carassius auratus]|uniref:NAD(P)(+)--arginine ADP-ribosyltransferase n=1 Tax=Carassius auratus TaxID=7957 RepID=A0A6P6MGY7_CARAU|nr:NAD(P)(+)--arginine ADP-ribosyltransferase 2-like [Carassius auratus]